MQLKVVILLIDTQKLKGLIVERGSSQKKLAKDIGMDRSTFYRKMKNGGNFTVEEAKKIKKSVPLTDSEAIEIFFEQKVALMR